MHKNFYNYAQHQLKIKCYLTTLWGLVHIQSIAQFEVSSELGPVCAQILSVEETLWGRD